MRINRFCTAAASFARSSKVVTIVLADVLLLACCPTFAQPTSAIPAQPKAKSQTQSPAPSETKSQTSTPATSAAPAQSPGPDECLARIKAMEPRLPALMEGAKSVIHGLIPDPAAYEKTLPPFDKVLADKDMKNLKNYGGLAEAYLYSGDQVNGERLFAKFNTARKLLSPEDTFPGGVSGDFGFMYFTQNKYADAEPLLLDSIKLYEAYPTPLTNNGLITDYMCLSLIRDAAGDKAAAGAYAKKLVDLALKEHQPSPK